MKHAIAQLEWLIHEDFRGRHGVEFFGCSAHECRHPPHAEDRERIRSYVRALRVLRAVAALEPPPLKAGDALVIYRKGDTL